MRTLKYFVLLASLVVSIPGVTRTAQPSVKLVYSPSFDASCAEEYGGRIKQEWQLELASRLDQVKALWGRAGPRLIEATEAITGKAFPPKQFTVRLTLCRIPSQSDYKGAIVINMRYALESFTPHHVPLQYKVNTIFHELLHKFLEAHPVTDSVLLKRYDAEPRRVRNHLHLLALEKAVLLELNKANQLKDLIAIDSLLPGGYYKRAWNIINATDTRFLKYVAEVSKQA